MSQDDQQDPPERFHSLGVWKLEAIIDSEPWNQFLLIGSDGTAISAMTDAEDNDPTSLGVRSKRHVQGYWEVTPSNIFKLSIPRLKNTIDWRDLKFEGRLSQNGTLAEGMVEEGSMDAECVGRFQFSPFMASIGAVNLTAYAQKAPPQLKWDMDQFEGDWLLFTKKREKSGFQSIFEVRLEKGGRFYTTQGVGDNKQIGGHWNLALTGYQQNITTIFMSCTRQHSKGIEMEVSRMYNYWGTIEGGEKPESITGRIMYGQFEPTQIGRFEMRPTSNHEVEGRG
eukprot:CAMPEP_0194577356 /NCGR_PEP_ID=MMETSP0292-20121207/12167_1 /TAXON_ID=39354 /ORGANISM="Heterosigma akashiwo, Strain CCMP2393" /LENGTH=281 /DNA_ID=CAMNT_0039429715 /DNA_START=214 /DNA_END=1059 /DNA_ORIENTATION=-